MRAPTRVLLAGGARERDVEQAEDPLDVGRAVDAAQRVAAEAVGDVEHGLGEVDHPLGDRGAGRSRRPPRRLRRPGPRRARRAARRPDRGSGPPSGGGTLPAAATGSHGSISSRCPAAIRALEPVEPRDLVGGDPVAGGDARRASRRGATVCDAGAAAADEIFCPIESRDALAQAVELQQVVEVGGVAARDRGEGVALDHGVVDRLLAAERLADALGVDVAVPRRRLGGPGRGSRRGASGMRSRSPGAMVVAAQVVQLRGCSSTSTLNSREMPDRVSPALTK